ncbi:MAG: hypothetical protein ACK5KL_10605 [Dysgonomonas sp.]
MKHISWLLIFIISSIYGNAQIDTNDSIPRIQMDNIYYPNPYRNNNLSEYYSPDQIDFSKDFLFLETKRTEANAFLVDVSKYSFEPDIFCTGDSGQNGIFDKDNQQIKIHITKTEKIDNDSLAFHIVGKSDMKGVICQLEGKITILSVYKYMADRVYPGQGIIFARYEFFENKEQEHPGIFRGIFKATIRINPKIQKIKLDERLNRGNLYNNRTYVGTWTTYDGETIKKCIWGDNRLPFTFDSAD